MTELTEAVPRPPRAESYEALRLSRNRAVLLAISAWPVAALALAALGFELANKSYVPPVVLTLDGQRHVSRSEVGTPEVLDAKESLVQGELARYVQERFTLDRNFRDEHVAYVRLHSSEKVGKAFAWEMSGENKDNPYYGMPEQAIRRVKDVRIRILDKDARKAEATFTTVVEGIGDGRPQYWHALISYTFVKQALTPENRYVNPVGFVVTAFEKNTEPGPGQAGAQ